MVEVITAFLTLYLISQIPLFIGGFMMDFMFKERHKQKLEKQYGKSYSEWSKNISPLYHHPLWPIIIHGLIVAMYFIFIFMFNIHWIILLSWVITYYNEDLWYYVGKNMFYFQYLPEKLPWLTTFMPIPSIRDNKVPKSSFIAYVTTSNIVNIVVMMLFYAIFIM